MPVKTRKLFTQGIKIVFEECGNTGIVCNFLDECRRILSKNGVEDPWTTGALSFQEDLDSGAKWVKVKCHSRSVAHAVWLARDLLKDTSYGLQRNLPGGIETEVMFFNQKSGSEPSYEPSGLSTWSQNNQSLITHLSKELGTVSVFSSEKQSGYECLDIFPFLGMERVMNRSRNALIGMPIAPAVNFIANQKVLAIEKAIANTGTSVQLLYEWEWGCSELFIEDQVWLMRLSAWTVSPEEVVLVASNAIKEQADIWRAIASEQLVK